MSRVRAWLAVPAAVWLAGCGSSDVADLLAVYPVTGMVLVNGTPAAGVSVMMIPVGETRGNGGFAITQPGGEFQIVSGDGREGVPDGDYKVLLTKWTLPDGSAIPPGSTAADGLAVNTLPEAYSDPDQSPAFVKVLPGQNPAVTIDIKPRRVARK